MTSSPEEQGEASEALGSGRLSALFWVSGAAALIYQVAWGRAFAPVFGGTTRSAAAVVSAFFLGMALGNWLGGRWASTRAVSLRRYALAELAIALGALAVLVWLALYRWAYPALYAWGVSLPGTLPAVQVGLGVLALGPPSVAIGATLPLMARAVTGSWGQAGSRVGLAYALNTFGATVGAGLAGFYLLDRLGTRGSIVLAVVLNLAVGLAAWQISRSASSSGVPPEGGEAVSPGAGEVRAPWAGRTAAAISGLATLALEVFLIRTLVNQTDGSSFSFALILCVFLVSLALGAALCAMMVDRIQAPWRIVAWAGLLAALGTFLTPLGFMFIREIMPDIAKSSGYWMSLASVSGLLIAPIVVAAGMVLPALWRMASSDVQDIGGQVGELTAINTLAGVVGSLAAAFWLLPWMGIVPGFGLIALMFSGLAFLGFYQTHRGWRRVWSLAAVTAFLLAGLWVDRVGTWNVPMISLRGAEEVVFYQEGEGGTVAVTRLPRGSLRLRVNDRYTLTSSVPAALRAQRSQSRLALSFVPRPRSAAFIGVGGAISMSALTEFPEVDRVLAMELIPGVLEAASHFGSANRNILEESRVEAVRADGRNHLYGRDERFDVIVGDVFSPWHAGTGYLFTAEHFNVVRERLSDQGVFVQWLQADQFSSEEIRIIVATFLDVFPQGELWMTVRSGPVPLLGLVGQAEGVSERRPQLKEGHSRLLKPFCSADQLKPWSLSADRNTDDRPVVEYRSARAHLKKARRRNSGVMKDLVAVCGPPER